MIDFISWWFDTHYIASTIFTPFTTWMWLLYTEGNTWRMIISSLLSIGEFLCIFMRTGNND